MTAPNGPSQQECVRGSMREAGLTANQITCSELHGDSVFCGNAMPSWMKVTRGCCWCAIYPYNYIYIVIVIYDIYIWYIYTIIYLNIRITSEMYQDVTSYFRLWSDMIPDVIWYGMIWCGMAVWHDIYIYILYHQQIYIYMYVCMFVISLCNYCSIPLIDDHGGFKLPWGPWGLDEIQMGKPRCSLVLWLIPSGKLT